MQIELAPEIALKLETMAVQANGMEFSGLGFVEWIKESETFYVYDFVLLDVGSHGWTEIPSEKLLPLYERSDVGNLKLWGHRHPVGNGVPGKHNWSGTDNRTCRLEPLGVPLGMQDSVKWSIAIVRTPRGWVGRYDTYGPKGRTAHIPVYPSFGHEIASAMDGIKASKVSEQTIPELRRMAPFVRWQDRPRRAYQQDQLFNVEDYDSEEEAWEAYYELLEEIDEKPRGEDEEEAALLISRHFWGEG